MTFVIFLYPKQVVYSDKGSAKLQRVTLPYPDVVYQQDSDEEQRQLGSRRTGNDYTKEQ